MLDPIDSKFSKADMTKELLIMSIPVSIIFAISGMDFIGFFAHLISNPGNPALYTRSLPNVLLGFLFTTISLFLIPYLIITKRWKLPLSSFGTQVGQKKWGIIIVVVFSLVAPFVYYFVSDNPDLINTYPLSKDALNSWGFFAFYEILYVIFYYIPYEFFFRGVLQTGLSKNWGPWKSILFVTALTTLLHITKPVIEIVAAAFAGIIFGIIAHKTKSWYYVFGLHIVIGLLNDIFCGMRFVGVIPT
jgi:membrane protease YdiL (CAAX protease family)